MYRRVFSKIPVAIHAGMRFHRVAILVECNDNLFHACTADKIVPSIKVSGFDHSSFEGKITSRVYIGEQSHLTREALDQQMQVQGVAMLVNTRVAPLHYIRNEHHRITNRYNH